MIGNLKDAARALACEADRQAIAPHDWRFKTDLIYQRQIVAHEGGWTHVGAGSARSTWRAPSGVSYKVTIGARSQSAAEWSMWQQYRHFASLTDETPEARLPQMRGLMVKGVLVLAVETILAPAADGMLNASAKHICKEMGIADTYGDNVLVLDGIQYLVDIGINRETY